MLFSHGPNKAFLVPDSCRATERNGNSISADILINQLQSLSIIWPSHTHTVWISHCVFYLEKNHNLFLYILGINIFFTPMKIYVLYQPESWIFFSEWLLFIPYHKKFECPPVNKGNCNQTMDQFLFQFVKLLSLNQLKYG